MSSPNLPAQRIARGSDRFGEFRSMGISTLCFKVSTHDTGGQFFLIEQTMHAPGGPPLHVHSAQEAGFF